MTAASLTSIGTGFRLPFQGARLLLRERGLWGPALVPLLAFDSSPRAGGVRCIRDRQVLRSLLIGAGLRRSCRQDSWTGESVDVNLQDYELIRRLLLRFMSATNSSALAAATRFSLALRYLMPTQPNATEAMPITMRNVRSENRHRPDFDALGSSVVMLLSIP